MILHSFERHVLIYYRKIVADLPGEKWNTQVDKVIDLYNNRVHSVTRMTPNQAWDPTVPADMCTKLDKLIFDRQQIRADQNARQWNKTATPPVTYKVGDRLLIRKVKPGKKGPTYPYQGCCSQNSAEQTKVKVIYITEGRKGEKPGEESKEWIYYQSIKKAPTYGETEGEGHSELLGTIMSPPRPAPIAHRPSLDVVPLVNPLEVARATQLLQQSAPDILQTLFQQYHEKMMAERRTAEAVPVTYDAVPVHFEPEVGPILDSGDESSEEEDSEEEVTVRFDEPEEVEEQVIQPKKRDIEPKKVISKNRKVEPKKVTAAKKTATVTAVEGEFHFLKKI